jgi:hypothetical protein
MDIKNMLDILLFKAMSPINEIGANLAGIGKVNYRACHEVLMESNSNCSPIVCD